MYIQTSPITPAAKAWEDLQRRIRQTRKVHSPWPENRALGIPASQFEALLDHWGTRYDWPANEARISAFPWAVVVTSRGPLRFIHQIAADRAAPTVVLLHGWPDSVLRFERLLPLLADVHLVVPALPGFPFSAPLTDALSAEAIAEMIAEAMGQIGCDRYVVSGGDVGGTIAELMAAACPDQVGALHLTNISLSRTATADPSRLPADALAFLERLGQWRRINGGFVAEQSTRPNTLIAGLGDSPAGLLAWIGEKLLDWSDSSPKEPAFSVDTLLTWVTAYWLTGTIGSSFCTYVEPTRMPARIEVPTILSSFARDIVPAPRSFVEQFVRLEQFIEHSSGGHFAAWESPELYAADLRRAIEVSRLC